MKILLIIIVVLIIIGLYYAPKETKTVLSATGSAVKEGAKVAYDDLKDNEGIVRLKENITNKIRGQDGTIPK